MEKCIGCVKGCDSFKKANEKQENAWFCENIKIWVYKTLPEGMRLATIDDINPNGRRVIGLKYMLLGIESKQYEAYPLTENTDLPNLVRFIQLNRCWVKK